MMTYKRYNAIIEFDDDAMIFHGEVIGIKDVVTFQGRNPEELKQAFKDSVDDYLEFCRQRGEKPDKPFSGHFVVRVEPDIHRSAYVSAKKHGMTLNQFVREAIEEKSLQS